MLTVGIGPWQIIGVMVTVFRFFSGSGKLKSSQGGFTLIEIAIGLTVIGLLMVPISQLYNIEKVDKELVASSNNLATIQSALNKFVTKTGRYPIPAARNIAAGDLNFGREFTGSLVGLPTCGTVNNTLCRTAGFRDINPVNGTLDPVLIGDLPFATLGLPKKYALDANKNRFTYVVTESLTATATFNISGGSIKVIDSTGSDHDGTSNDLHYVIVSHGRNGRGAVGLNGAVQVPCTGAGIDINNCNNDAQFNSNFAFDPTGKNVRMASYVAGSSYYDDWIIFDNSVGGDTWSKISTGTPSIFLRGDAKVRIGPGSGIPVAKLDIMGTTGKPGNVKATEVEANRLCGFSGCTAAGTTTGLANPAYLPNVFTPAIIAGPINTANAQRPGGGIYCGSNKALTGISNANELCNYNSFPSGFTVTPCSTAGTYPAGIDASGNFVCVIP